MPNVLYNTILRELETRLPDIIARGTLKRSLEVNNYYPDTISSSQMRVALKEHVYPSIRSFLSTEEFRNLKRLLTKILRESSW